MGVLTSEMYIARLRGGDIPTKTIYSRLWALRKQEPQAVARFLKVLGVAAIGVARFLSPTQGLLTLRSSLIKEFWLARSCV